MKAVRVYDRGKPEWLASLQNKGVERDQCRVQEILPRGYEKYLRLFHPFIPWGSDPLSTEAHERKTWRDLAEQLGVPLHPTLQWNTLRPVLPVEDDKRPYEVHTGEVEPLTRQRLLSHLSRHSSSQRAFFLYDLGAAIAGNDPFTLEADAHAIESVVQWVEERDVAAVSTPELVCPTIDDGSCVATTTCPPRTSPRPPRLRPTCLAIRCWRSSR